MNGGADSTGRSPTPAPIASGPWEGVTLSLVTPPVLGRSKCFRRDPVLSLSDVTHGEARSTVVRSAAPSLSSWPLSSSAVESSFTNMSSVQRLLSQLAFCLGLAVAPKVIQSPSTMTLLRGQTARINCSLWGREEWGDSARYYWSRHDSPIGCNRSQDFLKNGPRLTTRSDGSLVLLDVAVSDADTYYCCVVADTRPWTRLSGNGTQLNVQAKPELLLSVDPRVKADGIRTLSCEATRFFPRDLNISWTITGGVPSESEAGQPSVNGDGTYHLTSRLRIIETRQEPGPVVTCHVRHVTGNSSASKSFRLIRGFSKYYFVLLGLTFIVPLCLWIISNRYSKLKNGEESPGHVKNIGNQTTRKWVKDSVNKDKASLRDETLQYASVKFNNPPKGTQKQNLRTPEETFAKEYAVLKMNELGRLGPEPGSVLRGSYGFLCV
ncbi:uncharacterized protein [Narcine bancroftii]|uniref:uncharacterized protein n=1 Tax=Narcine bancroftii TaxID=1343680 RepID=UPI0038319091